jgi:hypothetical protein
MFKKVIVAEDLDSINIAVVQALEALGIPEIEKHPNPKSLFNC